MEEIKSEKSEVSSQKSEETGGNPTVRRVPCQNRLR